jgi:hypothetical protein
MFKTKNDVDFSFLYNYSMAGECITGEDTAYQHPARTMDRYSIQLSTEAQTMGYEWQPVFIKSRRLL